MTELEELVSEYNAVEAEQQGRLRELFARLAAGDGPKQVTFAGGLMWDNFPTDPAALAIFEAACLGRIERHITSVVGAGGAYTQPDEDVELRRPRRRVKEVRMYRGDWRRLQPTPES